MARLEDIRSIGGQKRVEAHAEEPTLVRSTFHMKEGVTEAQCRGTFLLQRLANILLPGVMPNAHSFGRDEKTGEFYMDIERVDLDVLHLEAHEPLNENGAVEHNEHERLFYQRRLHDVAGENAAIVQKLENAGFTVDYLSGNINWSFAGGNIKYLDSVQPWDHGTLMFRPDRLRRAIDDLEDAEHREEALAIFYELMELVPKEVSV